MSMWEVWNRLCKNLRKVGIKIEPGKGTWQNGWEPEHREQTSGQEDQERETWGTGKDQKKVIAVKISTNTVRPFGVRQQGCKEKFWEDRQIGSA